MALEPNKIPYADPLLDDDKVHVSRTWLNYFTSWANQIAAGVVQSVTGTAGRILVTGTSKDPIINIDPAYVASAAQGGTGQSNYLLGDTLYASSPAALSRLPGIIPTSRHFLSQTGTGSASAAPSWTPPVSAMVSIPGRLIRGTTTGDIAAVGGQIILQAGDNLAGVIAAIGAVTSTNVSICGEMAVTSNLTIPSNISIVVLKGGSFAISTGVTLTMPVPEAGRFQIYTGAGSVTFSESGAILADWFGSEGIQKAHDAIGNLYGGAISLDGVYETATGIIISKRAVFITGARPGNEPNGVADSESMTQIKYTGAQDNTLAVIKVTGNAHNFSIHDLFINSNDLAGFGLYQIGISSPAGLTRGGSVDSVAFRGYRVAGWVIGDDTDVLNDAQFHQIVGRNIYLRGGAGGLGANGIHLNAQNCEFLTIVGLYIDPRSDGGGRHHTNHIRQISGGLNVTGLLSTRAGTTTTTGGYAIYSQDQIIINGWRSEDRYLLQTVATTIRAPSFISGLIQRPDSPAETVATDPVIDIGHTVGSLTLVSPRINGSIRIGGTSAHYVQVQGAIFSRVGAGFVYNGPRNAIGLFHDITTGDFSLAGSAPSMRLVTADGTVRWESEDGSVRTPAISPTQITANQNDYDMGAGTFFRLSTDAARSITGFDGGTSGRAMVIVQTSAFALTLAHQSASSSTENRILSVSGLDIILNQNEMAHLIWDSSTSRWRAWKVALSSGTVTGILTVSGLVTAQAGVIFGLGGSAQGMGFRTAANGLAFRAYPGTSNDMNFRAADDTIMLQNPNGTTVLQAQTRLETKLGSNVVSSNDLTLLNDGNIFPVSLNTAINGIATVNWQAGSVVSLHFSGTPTIKHNTAASAGFASIKLSGSVDLVASADTILTLYLDGTYWQETSRKVP